MDIANMVLYLCSDKADGLPWRTWMDIQHMKRTGLIASSFISKHFTIGLNDLLIPVE